MKKLILFFTGFAVVQIVYGQVETKFFPDGDAFNQVKHVREHPKINKTKELPSFNIHRMIEEDEQSKELDIPFRFGKGFDTNIALADGEWTNVEGGRL